MRIGVKIFARMKKERLYYLLMVPGIIFYLVFCYAPMYGIILAFKDVKPFVGIQEMLSSPFVGFLHFKNLFSSYYFGNILRNTLVISFLRLLFGFPVPLLFALLLNELQNVFYKKFVQTISYIPYFISMVILLGLVNKMVSTNGGLVNEILKLFGKESIFFMGSEKYFRGVLIISGIWKNMGWDSIIYLAAITSVSPELYEAAISDGATRFQMAIHITLPSISTVLTIMIIFAIGGIMNAGFEQILLFYSEAVYKVSDIIDTFVYRQGIKEARYSYSIAVGLFKSIISMILLLGANYSAKHFGQEGIW